MYHGASEIHSMRSDLWIVLPIEKIDIMVLQSGWRESNSENRLTRIRVHKTLSKKSVLFSSSMAGNDVKCSNQWDRLTSFSGLKCEENTKSFRLKFHRIQVLVTPFLRVGFRSSRPRLCRFICFNRWPYVWIKPWKCQFFRSKTRVVNGELVWPWKCQFFQILNFHRKHMLKISSSDLEEDSTVVSRSNAVFKFDTRV